MVFFDKKIPTAGRGNITSFDYVTQLLSVDPDSRQAIIHYGHPALFWEGQLDVPCTCHQQFFIRGDCLECITTMRSQDVWRGMVYDVPWFVYVQEKVRQEVSRLLGREIEMGAYHHNVGSLHIYESNIEDAKTELGITDLF
jgi:thymidylate synthase